VLELIYTTQFKKDYKRVKKSGKSISKLKDVIDLLVNQRKIPIIYKEHKLIGNYKNRRELHLKPDLLLIYKVDSKQLILERIGSHSELFN
jgi:mRNA interferase YafQ